MTGEEGGLHKVHVGGCRDAVDSYSEGQMEERDTAVPGRRTQDRGLGRAPSRGQLVGECSEAASADKRRSCLQKDREKFQIIIALCRQKAKNIFETISLQPFVISLKYVQCRFCG